MLSAGSVCRRSNPKIEIQEEDIQLQAQQSRIGSKDRSLSCWRGNGKTLRILMLMSM
jgi:hypothetical protein